MTDPTVVMLDQLARVVFMEGIKALVWSTVALSLYRLMVRR